MPNHGRGRIRAEALHAWHNQEDAPYRPLTYADYPRQPYRQVESVGVLKDEMLVAEEKEIEGQQLTYIPQGEVMTSN